MRKIWTTNMDSVSVILVSGLLSTVSSLQTGKYDSAPLTLDPVTPNSIRHCVGDDVILSWTYNVSSNISVLSWKYGTTNNSVLIATYDIGNGSASDFGPYIGRTEVKGSAQIASLILQNVQLKDSGRYTLALHEPQTEVEVGSEHLHIHYYSYSDLTLEIDGQNVTFGSAHEITASKDYNGSISLSADVPFTANLTLNPAGIMHQCSWQRQCRVHYTLHDAETQNLTLRVDFGVCAILHGYIILQAVQGSSNPVSSGSVAVSAIFGILAVPCALIIAFVVITRKKQRKLTKSDREFLYGVRDFALRIPFLRPPKNVGSMEESRVLMNRNQAGKPTCVIELQTVNKPPEVSEGQFLMGLIKKDKRETDQFQGLKVDSIEDLADPLYINVPDMQYKTKVSEDAESHKPLSNVDVPVTHTGGIKSPKHDYINVESELNQSVEIDSKNLKDSRPDYINIKSEKIEPVSHEEVDGRNNKSVSNKIQNTGSESETASDSSEESEESKPGESEEESEESEEESEEESAESGEESGESEETEEESEEETQESEEEDETSSEEGETVNDEESEGDEDSTDEEVEDNLSDHSANRRPVTEL